MRSKLCVGHRVNSTSRISSSAFVLLVGATLLLFSQKSLAERRIALVIGNSSYSEGPLRNPVNDASDMADRLSGFGFKVTRLLDAGQREMKEAVQAFNHELTADSIALFYYAGHGLQIDGENYLVPINASIKTESDAAYEAVALGRVVEGMRLSGSGLNLVILDACRNNPFSRSWRSSTRGLARSSPASGTMILYATEPGSVAGDGDGRNGVFTEALLNTMDTDSSLMIERLFKKVSMRVYEKTDGKQSMWSEGNIRGDFSFTKPPAVPAPPTVPTATSPETTIIASLPIAPNKPTDTANRRLNYEPEMVRIEGGDFEMGSNNYDHEKPIHSVTIKEFEIGRYEVTFDEYDEYAKAKKSVDLPDDEGWGRGRRPVINVTWEDAQSYVKWLSNETGKNYRLPSESEWEYAARAGSKGKYSYGDNEKELCGYANGYNGSMRCDDDEEYTAEVGSYEANINGLNDVNGNVWEWVEDCWNGSYTGAPVNGKAWLEGEDCALRVLRGGGWYDEPASLRSANRVGDNTSYQNYDTGFRVARTLNP